MFTILSTQAQVTVNNELKGLISQSFGYFPRVKEMQNTVATAQEKANPYGAEQIPGYNSRCLLRLYKAQSGNTDQRR